MNLAVAPSPKRAEKTPSNHRFWLNKNHKEFFLWLVQRLGREVAWTSLETTGARLGFGAVAFQHHVILSLVPSHHLQFPTRLSLELEFALSPEIKHNNISC